MKMILILLAFLPHPSFSEGLGKVVGQLGLVEGEVLVDSKAVKKDAPVREGSVIEVKSGKATLLIGKGSVFNLAKDSKMVVTQYGVKDGTHEEVADLDLKFGRTRALILNQGGEKKDIKIRARAATMGVRGTEIFVDAPKDSSKPIQFFTLEGKAVVTAHPNAAPVTVNQNQGVSTSGVAPPASSSSTSGSGKSGGTSSAASTGVAQTTGDTAPSTTSVSDVKKELKSSGLETTASQIPVGVAVNTAAAPGTLSGQLTIGSLPPIQYDPIQDRYSPLIVKPHFCSANAGTCN